MWQLAVCFCNINLALHQLHAEKAAESSLRVLQTKEYIVGTFELLKEIPQDIKGLPQNVSRPPSASPVHCDGYHRMWAHCQPSVGSL